MKILVVDDQQYNRELLSFILQDEGYEVQSAVNGVDACEKCRNFDDIDVILMDVTMPEMDGITATSVIKKENQNRLIPVIFVTALDDAEVLARCLEAGGDDFVPKPINESVLLAKIKAHKRTAELYSNLHSANRELEYHKRLMDREHQIVERIFDRGAKRIQTDCTNIKKYSSPMSMFNGDIVLEAPSPSGGIYNLVGDFTGHGLAASIGTLPVTEIFYRLAAQQASIALLAKDINRSLVDLLPENMFFCGAITYLDSACNELAIWAGGMSDILHLKPGANEIKYIASEHMPLGILVDEEFDETPSLVALEENDHIFIYTDGINEATNDEGTEFGVDGIKRTILENNENRLDALVSAVKEFQGGKGQNDDISLIEIVASPLTHIDKKTSNVVDIKSQFNAADSFPWNFSMRLENEELRSTSIVDQLMVFVGGIQGIELHREKIFTIVSELYSNALEHGVLGLSSSLKDTADGFEEYYRLRQERLQNIDGQSIFLQFTFLKGETNSVELKITDSGKGFDFQAMLDKLANDTQAHGRGLPLLQSLCATLEYSNEGRTVRAVYELH